MKHAPGVLWAKEKKRDWDKVRGSDSKQSKGRGKRGKELISSPKQAKLPTGEIDTKFSAAAASGNNF